MSNKILFIFEGEKTEEQIVSNLKKVFPQIGTIVQCAYGGEIYQLYEAIKADEDLDTFNLIKERNIKRNRILKNYNRDNFAEIYLFFDYDGHSTIADDDKLRELLDFFNEETDKGKLYVSYPMVEALRHICDYNTFKETTVSCKNNVRYKNVVYKEARKDLENCKKYNLDTWKKVILAHLKKANFITNDTFELPDTLISQLFIFSKQLEKYIIKEQKVAVLSAFPMFLHDYYGNEKMKEKLDLNIHP
ncbi:MAG: hypothetical protein RL757_2547 [Bacteroidota bacterium]|jgi:hypothetical protein